MKKFYLITLLILPFFVFAQGLSVDLGAGVSFAGGDAYEDSSTGIDLKFLSVNYNFSEKFGITVGLASSGHGFEDSDTTAGLSRFSIGPSLTTPIGNISWELKPQISISSSGIIENSGIETDIDKASGFIIGNSLLFGSNEGLQFIANVDFVTGKINEVEGFEIDEDNGYSFFNLGVGLRYNF